MAAVSVGTTAVRLDTVSDDSEGIAGQSIWIYNNGAADVYLEKTNAVTTATGVPVPPDQHATLDLAKSDAVWAIVASGTVEVRVFETGV